MKNTQFISIQELANILGISRIAVYKKIKKGQIKAMKIGRNFAIPKKYVEHILGHTLSVKDKHGIDKAIKRIVREYGETLKLLGRA
jgi:excisionase family DNA binding protein